MPGGLEQREDRVCTRAVLGGFTGQIHLDEEIDDSTRRRAPPRQLKENRDRVNGLNHVETRGARALLNWRCRSDASAAATPDVPAIFEAPLEPCSRRNRAALRLRLNDVVGVKRLGNGDESNR